LKGCKRSPKIVGLAKGRLDHGPPIAVIDIGSNSIRLVIYEGLTRSPTPIFNEKVLAGLGRQVQSTGLLPADAIDTALDALRRFRALCDILHVHRVWAIATAACRDARNGRAFIAEAERICRTTITILSGKREAHLTALGIVSGIHKPDGIVGDLGGGSLELVDVHGSRVRGGVTLPLGGLALQDITGKSLKKAEKFVEEAFEDLDMLHDGEDRTFYAVGGTWRALARLHMWQTGYPFHVMHNYRISAREAQEFSRLVHHVDTETLSKIEVVNAARRPLLAYAALVMENLVRTIKPRQVIISVLGVREGLLYSLLNQRECARDPLISAAADLNVLRSRSPRHGEELIAWTDRFMASSGLEESSDERRLRHAACLLSDVGWRAHPDYRGIQSLNLVAHGTFVGVDHPGRAFLALTVYYRNEGLVKDELSQRLVELVDKDMLKRARILGAAFRAAHMVSAAMPGVLTNTPITYEGNRLIWTLPDPYSNLEGERVERRFKALANLLDREGEIRVGSAFQLAAS